ncbi:EF-hand [Coniophora puteana RWD-64-598 SS2]|uniref:EF-hand n=1 Tax=Coniophora puteana (strain RWD-64-598) TaxID=741705 RepID=A0A5M3N7U1_CONPW|nr:EF-hand [Coniophora puteana RWD-64-598 SS2]EIW86915.1 EF-hand [Coniophora puteana RWD-64-598 SS2]
MSRYPDYLSPSAAPAKLSKAQKSRARREPSGVFSLFEPQQIQQFKEAFQLIDHDKDGWVTEPDLRELFTSLGITPSKTMIDDLLSARPGGRGHSRMSSASMAEPASGEKGINFTMFLTMMSERLFEFDPENELQEAFECFDEDDSGSVKVNEMRKWMSEVGERMDEKEAQYLILCIQIDKFLKSSFADRQGNFNYREWIKVLRVNDEGEEAEAS